MSGKIREAGSKKTPWRLIPTWRQWRTWSLPSKLTAIGAGVGVLGLIAALIFNFFPRMPVPDRPNVRVFFSAWQTKSDFELERGGRSLLFVPIPPMTNPVDRLVFAAARIRPVNFGNQSLRDLQVITIAGDSLWNPHLGEVEELLVAPVTGADDFKVEVQRVEDKWIATRTIPRLDPQGGAPCPVFFVLEVSAMTPEGPVRFETRGNIEIRVSGEDWPGIYHIVDIQCVLAASAEEFVAKCKSIARSLRDEGYPNVPVMLASTGGKGIKPIENGPTIVEASIDKFFSLGEGKLYDLN